MLILSAHLFLIPLQQGSGRVPEEGKCTMLVADANANPYFKELCDAAKEIAELKAQIARLEKVVDGVLAQHLAGQEPSVGMMSAPDAPLHSENVETFQQDDTDQVDGAFAYHDDVVYSADEDESCDTDISQSASHDSESTADCETLNDQTAATSGETDPQPLPSGSLPNALRSLICRPLKPVFESPDDLTLIKGIDCAMALQLAGHGISSFQDISELDTEKIANLCADIPEAERIYKDVWIAQATLLADGKLTTFARQMNEERNVEEAEFTLKPDVIPLDILSDDTTRDITESEIILDDKIDVEGMIKDQASAMIEELSMRDLPRTIVIERPMTTLVRTGENVTSFIPMAAKDAGFAVQKIVHSAPHRTRDFGNIRALAASLVAAAVIYAATTTSGVAGLDGNVVQIMQTDVCKLASWSSYPDACKQLFGIVL